MQRSPAHSLEADLKALDRAESSCPGDERLFSLALGELAGAAQHEAEAHVRDCADCREILSEALRSLGGDAPPSAPMGQVLLERYELREPIGSGGAGIVYRGYDPALEREVAVKILRPDLPGSQDAFQARLRREAQATAQLSHPNVVTAYDVGATESGGFIVLEYFSGGTLEDWLRGDHPLEERVRVLLEAGRGLAAAHDKGLVHRDFKPQNVLMSEDGRVCVTDFGLARLDDVGKLRGFEMNASVGDATQTRGLMGTPSYMAPEVFEGARGNEASDQFSYAVALYQALNERHPFQTAADTTLSELLTRMKTGLIAPPLTSVPEQLSKVIERGLSADPAQRFGSMNELLGALEEKPRRRLGLLSASALALSVLALIGLGLWLGFFRSSQPQSSSTAPEREVVTREPAPGAFDAAPRTEAPEGPAEQDAAPPSTESSATSARPKTPPRKAVPKARSTPAAAPPSTKKDEERFDDGLRDPF